MAAGSFEPAKAATKSGRARSITSRSPYRGQPNLGIPPMKSSIRPASQRLSDMPADPTLLARGPLRRPSVFDPTAATPENILAPHRAAAAVGVANPHPHHRRHRHLLRRLRCAVDRLCAARHRAAMEARLCRCEFFDLVGLSGPADRGADRRGAGGAVRAAAGDRRGGVLVRRVQHRLRIRLELPLARGAAAAPGARPRRRGAGGRHLYQRACQGAWARPLRAAVRTGVSGRPAGRGHSRAMDRPQSRLAIPVFCRRHPGLAGAGDDAQSAGVAALAGGPRPRRGSRTRHGVHRGAGERRNRRPPAARRGRC